MGLGANINTSSPGGDKAGALPMPLLSLTSIPSRQYRVEDRNLDVWLGKWSRVATEELLGFDTEILP